MYVSGPYISHVQAPLSNLIPITFPNLFFSVESKAISSFFFLTFSRISSNLRLISISVYALGLLSFFFFILIYLIDITF